MENNSANSGQVQSKSSTLIVYFEINYKMKACALSTVCVVMVNFTR